MWKANAVNQVLQQDNGDCYKISKNEDIAPSLNKMINFFALMEQQFIDEALMWMKGHGKSDFDQLKQRWNNTTTK